MRVCVCVRVYIYVCVSIYYSVSYIYIYIYILYIYIYAIKSQLYTCCIHSPNHLVHFRTHGSYHLHEKILRKRPRSNSSSSLLYKRRTDSAGEAALAPSASKVSNGASRASEGRDQVSGSASAGHGATPRDGHDWGKMMKRWVANRPQP